MNHFNNLAALLKIKIIILSTVFSTGQLFANNSYSDQKYIDLIPGPFAAAKDYATVPKFTDNIMPSCKPTKIDHPLVKGRSLKVKFPDGREISVIGHIHGKRQFYQFVDLLGSQQLSQINQNDFENYFNRILTENKQFIQDLVTKSDIQSFIKSIKDKTGFDPSHIVNVENSFDIKKASVLDHARQDYDFLTEQIQFLPSQSFFVGYEAMSDHFSNILKNYSMTYYNLIHEVKKRKSINQFSIPMNDVEDTFLSSLMGQMYYFLKNPDLLKHIYFVGTESNYIDHFFSEEDQIDKHVQTQNLIIKKIDEEIIQLQAQNQKLDSLLVYFSSVMSASYKISIMNYKNEDEIENDFSIIFKLIPEGFRPLTLQFKNDVLNRFKLMHFRNYNSALYLSLMNRSGFHFVGLNHLYDTAYILSALCHYETLYFGNKRNK